MKGKWGVYNVEWNTSETHIMSQSELKSLEAGTVYGLVQAQVTLANAWDDFFSASGNLVYEKSSKTDETELSKGYQVRCMKIK